MAEPVTLVRSPIIWKIESLRIGSVSRPEKKVVRARASASGVGSGRGGTLATDSAIARMWAGVVPQQPPTMLTRPLVANSPTRRPVVSGASSYSPKALGRPAFG